MKMSRFLGAALVGLTLATGSIVSPAMAERLTIVNRNSDSQLKVAINRAVVVESDVVFAELSIANPQIADISSLSDRSIYVLGKQPGTTTLTLLDAEGRLISNVDVVVSADISEFKERIRQIAERFPDADIVYPMHMNPNVREPVQRHRQHRDRRAARCRSPL